MNGANDRLTLTVAAVETANESGDIISVDLMDVTGALLPPFEAGAHIDVHMSDGLVRQYSLCNAPSERHRYRLGVLRSPESRGGSIHLHQHLKAGAQLVVGTPRNAFRLRVGTGYALLIAGGIGITPLLAMAYRLAELDVPFELHYCVKSADRAAFIPLLDSSPFVGRVHLHCDDGANDQRFDPATFTRHRESDVYLCGPNGFMDWITASAAAAGIPSSHIHSERFSGAGILSGAESSFTVTAARSGLTVTVTGTESIAEALRKGGISISLSCEQGVCGTCLTPVFEGIPDHRDLYQTDQEKAANTHMTLCCSRAKSARLVLDL